MAELWLYGKLWWGTCGHSVRMEVMVRNNSFSTPWDEWAVSRGPWPCHGSQRRSRYLYRRRTRPTVAASAGELWDSCIWNDLVYQLPDQTGGSTSMMPRGEPRKAKVFLIRVGLRGPNPGQKRILALSSCAEPRTCHSAAWPSQGDRTELVSASEKWCPGTCAHQRLKFKSTGQCGLAILEEMVLQFESEGQWLPGDWTPSCLGNPVFFLKYFAGWRSPRVHSQGSSAFLKIETITQHRVAHSRSWHLRILSRHAMVSRIVTPSVFNWGFSHGLPSRALVYTQEFQARDVSTVRIFIGHHLLFH